MRSAIDKTRSAIAKGLTWVLYRVDDWLLPGVAMLHAHPYIDRDRAAKLKSETQERGLLTQRFAGWSGAFEASRAAYDAEMGRRDAIERKALGLVGASGTIFGVVTAAGLLSALVPEGIGSDSRFLVAGLLMLPLICFALAFYLALNSWRVGIIRWVGTNELRDVSLTPVPDRETVHAVELLLATEDNQRILLKRINYLNSAERWVNRGVLVGLVVGIIMLVLGITTDVLDPQDKPAVYEDVTPIGNSAQHYSLVSASLSLVSFGGLGLDVRATLRQRHGQSGRRAQDQ